MVKLAVAAVAAVAAVCQDSPAHFGRGILGRIDLARGGTEVVGVGMAMATTDELGLKGPVRHWARVVEPERHNSPDRVGNLFEIEVEVEVGIGVGKG